MASSNALAELPDAEHPARTLIHTHKQRQFRRLVALCSQLELNEPEQIAEELTLLMEGAQVVAQNKGVEKVGERLTRMVQRRLQTAA
ncbi:hypothetical protein AABC73_16770 [Pseudomonas sp. G.S.17]|uniref:hypothetical protein n=1 Tax=Pseudomonas sp. G.S.17 TaxID=3137451 RepID=UPI00311C9AC5